MNPISFQSFLYSFEMKDSQAFSKFFLEYLSKQKRSSLNEGYDRISNTDWHIKNDFSREYVKPFCDRIIPSLETLSNSYNLYRIEISGVWFQQYEQHSRHGWHVHPQSNWSGVYYVELPHDHLRTEFLNVQEQQTIQPILNDNCIVFPSNIMHRSPENNTHQRKTSISFNFNFS